MKQYSHTWQAAIVLILYLASQVELSKRGMKQKTANNNNGYIFQWDILILKLKPYLRFVKLFFVKVLFYQLIYAGDIASKPIIIQSISQ